MLREAGICSGLDADRKQGSSRVEYLNEPYREGGDGARLKLRFVQKWSHTRSPQLGEGVFGSLRVTLDLSVLRQDCGVPFCLFLLVSISARSHSPLSDVGVLGHRVIPYKLAVAEWQAALLVTLSVVSATLMIRVQWLFSAVVCPGLFSGAWNACIKNYSKPESKTMVESIWKRVK